MSYGSTPASIRYSSKESDARIEELSFLNDPEFLNNPVKFMSSIGPWSITNQWQSKNELGRGDGGALARAELETCQILPHSTNLEWWAYLGSLLICYYYPFYAYSFPSPINSPICHYHQLCLLVNFSIRARILVSIL